MSAKPSMKSLLLSLDGRVPRLTWWLFWIASTLAATGAIVVDFMIGTFDMESGIGVVYSIVALLLLWPWIAVNVKRLHDRNRSGWFLLLLLVPLVNIWILIELAFLGGTAGSNRFGDDPGGIQAAPAAA